MIESFSLIFFSCIADSRTDVWASALCLLARVRKRERERERRVRRKRERERERERRELLVNCSRKVVEFVMVQLWE